MRTLQQSATLRSAFQQKITAKKAAKHEEIHEVLGNGILGGIGSFMYEFNQAKNQFKGSMGECGVSLILQQLPDTWVMFNNALIPAGKPGNLTEIDHIIIGTGGVFLLEIKTWKGSFSAYNDKWKRREGSNWVAISDSPTSQSAYHQKMFSQWINSVIPNLPDNFVYAPVVFPIAKWLGVNNCSVPVLQGVPALLQTMVNSSVCLTIQQIQSIAQVIQDYTTTENTTPSPKPIPKPKITNSQNCPFQAARDLMLHGVLTEYLHRYLEIRRSLWRNAGAAPSLYSDAETAVGANAYHSEKSPELAHQEDLRDRSQIHSRVLDLNPYGIKFKTLP